MKAQDLLQLRAEVSSEALERLDENYLQPSSQAFKDRYELWLLSWERREKNADGAPEEGDEG
jgi:hypothetical protein